MNVENLALWEANSQAGSRTSTYPPSGPLGTDRDEAALVEHYPRLVRLAYLVLPSSTARHRRVRTAHSLVQRALPVVRDIGGSGAAGGTYARLASRVLRAALAGERHRRIGPWRLPLPAPRSGIFPIVYGLRLFPRSGGADELALDQALSEVSGAARAAYVLRGLEGMTDAAVRRVLSDAKVREPAAALAEADRVPGPAGSGDGALLSSAEFDPCLLQARPTDLIKRRQHTRAALAALAAVVVCTALLGAPGGSWGPEGAAAPSYARNPSAEKALDPGELTRVPAGAWRNASRVDFSVWPARGDLTGDRALLRRALAVWARPGSQVTVSVTRGTSAGPPVGPPQLLYAGRVDGANVVLLHDGLRVVRYAEAEGSEEGGAVLDLARTDSADAAAAGALVISRSDSDVRYLTAPWVKRAAEADLLRPTDRGNHLAREEDGVIAALTGPGKDPADCTRWPGLLLTSRSVSGRSQERLYTDLGESTAVRLTTGAPGTGQREATGSAAREVLARTVCSLPSMQGAGVRSVNTWAYGRQLLPEGEGVASWSCMRGETWRGPGARVVSGFEPPVEKPAEPAVITARAADTPACGPREPHVVSGVLWKSTAGNRYLLAAGSEQVTAISAGGGSGQGGASAGRVLALPAKKGPKPRLTARLADGKLLHEPRRAPGS